MKQDYNRYIQLNFYLLKKKEQTKRKVRNCGSNGPVLFSDTVYIRLWGGNIREQYRNVRATVENFLTQL